MIVNQHCNTLPRLLQYFFGVGVKDSDLRDEFLMFWGSLTVEEMNYYRSVDLDTGRPCVEQTCMHYVWAV